MGAVVAQQAVSDRMQGDAVGMSMVGVPQFSVRLAGALLALAVATAHVADQGGLTAFTAPDWRGWAYRLVEVGGVLTFLALLWIRSERAGWMAGVLLGAGPFLAYIASRTVGVPGDPSDVGNWADWVGTFALIVEVGLITLSVGMLRATRARHEVT
jgi:hypothetical protein